MGEAEAEKPTPEESTTTEGATEEGGATEEATSGTDEEAKG